jgi:equilibrative nucleoside transporter 1/2/3
MYLAAAPYFSQCFQSSPWASKNFQSSIISVGTLTNLISMLILANLQSKASYPKRIFLALLINTFAFTLLAISTITFRTIGPPIYLSFLLLTVLLTSTATGLMQNGAFAFAASFGHPSYTQAILTGQAIAGVLPSIAQIASVLALPPPSTEADTNIADSGTSKSAFAYFLTATLISLLAFTLFIPLVRRHNALLESRMLSSITSIEEAERAHRKVVGMLDLYKKLHWHASAIFTCFFVTMFFPVYTAQITSVNSDVHIVSAPRWAAPNVFIPLAFLLWNTGDLSGRLLSLIPFRPFSLYPSTLFVFALLRSLFIPLYLLCNIRGAGAVINSDAFYMAVQLGFGVSNGWLAGKCMMEATEWVGEEEREATGGFMGFNLVAGLAAGSLGSFLVAGG